MSETHEEGLASLYYGVEARRGFVLLTGEVGAGKTTLLRAVIDDLPAGTSVAVVFNTAGLDSLDLLELVARDLQIQVPARNKASYIIAINELLLRRLETGQNTVLIIDEAQNLSPSALEEVRLLSNLETASDKLLQIVLTGQPELRDLLARPDLRALRQRIAIEHHVDFLQPEQIQPYLAHRIEIAGGRYDAIFPYGADQLFYSASLGCPRLVNQLADRSLLAAYSRQLRPIPLALIEQKAKGMQDMLPLDSSFMRRNSGEPGS
ncbi:MAG: AAA family ATPase [Myxococcota bacterium]|nr:AAA family ATPase [Myxococcota bacterium]